MPNLNVDALPGATLFIENLNTAPFAKGGEKRVLFFAPRDFDRTKPCRVFVFFHGDGGKVGGNIVGLGTENYKYRLPHQVAAADPQTVLLVPQRPDAAGVGAFAIKGAFSGFLKEAGEVLAGKLSMPPEHFGHAPLVVGAFSRGRGQCLDTLRVGDATPRVRALVLVDLFFGGRGPLDYTQLLQDHPSWACCLHYGSRTRGFSKGAFSGLKPRSRLAPPENEAAFGTAPIPPGQVVVCEGTQTHELIVADGLGGSPIQRMLKRLA